MPSLFCSVICRSIVPHILDLTNSDVGIQLEIAMLSVRHKSCPRLTLENYKLNTMYDDVIVGGDSQTNHDLFMQLVPKKCLSPTTCHFQNI